MINESRIGKIAATKDTPDFVIAACSNLGPRIHSDIHLTTRRTHSYHHLLSLEYCGGVSDARAAELVVDGGVPVNNIVIKAKGREREHNTYLWISVSLLDGRTTAWTT